MTSHRSGKKKDFDDQAWGVESDDDDFVTQIAPRTNVPRSLKSSSRSSSYSAALPADQARPPLDARQSSSASLHDTLHKSTDRSTSWMVVDRDTAAEQRSSSPPVDLGAEASSSNSGFQLVANQQTTTTSPTRLQLGDVDSSGSDTDDFDLDTGKSVRRKRANSRKSRPGESEADSLRRSIRRDMHQILTDPTHILSRLSISWAAPPVESDLEVRSEPPVTTRTPRSTGFTFDPIAAAGDGLIMTGHSFVDSVDDKLASQPGFRATNGSTSHALHRKRSVRTSRRRQQLLNCLSKQSVDFGQLRTMAWAGIPDELRPLVWQLLLGYLPAVASVRSSQLARKRAEYASGVRLAFARGTAGLDQSIWHQIHIDVPRTNPGIRLWQREATQRALERILYVWALRHPASGYVQGMNDLATPFFEVFLSAYIDSDAELFDISLLPPNVVEAIEADTFWCLSKLLDGIHDNYTHGQKGIHNQIRMMQELMPRMDGKRQPKTLY